MENNHIEVAQGDLICRIGRQVNGFVNISTNFEPLALPIMVTELRGSASVSYVSNVAFYGKGQGGGLAVRLQEGKTEDDLQLDLRRALRIGIEGCSLFGLHDVMNSKPQA